MAQLFGVAPNTVTEHLKNIFREGEVDEGATTRKFRGVGPNGKECNYLHYNLDAILSVGYRVSSRKATEFRRWATGVLKSYLVTGYALNETKLRNDPNALRELAAKVRELRSNEASIYQAVRDVFAMSSDYSSSSPTARSFYAKLQDKWLYAVTDKTACQIILDRADSDEPHMGVKSPKGPVVTKPEALVGKNYLDADELYTLHILCEQFLLFVESKAVRGARLRMDELAAKFDQLLEVQVPRDSPAEHLDVAAGMTNGHDHAAAQPVPCDGAAYMLLAQLLYPGLVQCSGR
jgi:hypothetical protein